MRGFAVHTSILNEPSVIMLSAREFRRQFYAALDGEQNAFSPFVRRWNGRLPAYEWAELRSTVFLRDDFTCAYCGSRGGKLECDHIIPVSRGGSHELDNLVTACKPCNRAKAGKFLSEWRR